MKLALLSNVTTSLLGRMLVARGVRVWEAPGFGAWIEESLNPSADFLAFDPDAIALLVDTRFAAVDMAYLPQAEAALARRFPRAAIVPFDVTRFAADRGEAFYDARFWHVASQPWSLDGLRELAGALVPKKVLALDLDGTVWDGVLGEDGASALRPRRECLEKVRELVSRGILLVAISKNDADDVHAAFAAGATAGLLKEEDFAALKLGWRAKNEMLAEVARELGLGLDTFVFVDDNPGERAQMRAACSEVTVADFPPQWDVFFPRFAVTGADRLRNADYLAERSRRALRATRTFEDYLAELRIEVESHPIRADEVARVAQLAGRTNQFNVDPHRYSEEEIARFAADPTRLVLTAHARDRFGDQGLVAFVHVKDGEILDWVMSCRAMNRRIEFSVERDLERLLRVRGVRRLTAHWRRTDRNAPVRELFDAFGFIPVSVTADARTYRRDLS